MAQCQLHQLERIRRSSVLTSVLLIFLPLVGCEKKEQKALIAPLHRATMSQVESEVVEAGVAYAINSWKWKPRRVVVRGRTVSVNQSMPTSTHLKSVRRALDGKVTEFTWRSLMINNETYSELTNVFEHTKWASVVDSETLEEQLESGWDMFKARNNGAEAFVECSRPGFDRTQREAVLYVLISRGGLGGSEQIIILRLFKNQWQVMESFPVSIN